MESRRRIRLIAIGALSGAVGSDLFFGKTHSEQARQIVPALLRYRPSPTGFARTSFPEQHSLTAATAAAAAAAAARTTLKPSNTYERGPAVMFASTVRSAVAASRRSALASTSSTASSSSSSSGSSLARRQLTTSAQLSADVASSAKATAEAAAKGAKATVEATASGAHFFCLVLLLAGSFPRSTRSKDGKG
ncbi:unnamed protein product [Tilletia controversa]|nr:unnamed protein product [Tilletia controversa]